MDLFVTAVIESVKLCGDPILMLLILVGTLWGCIAGALPGVGPNLAVVLMLPFTFGIGPVYAVATLVAVNVAVSYGNSIPAILVGVPGTTSAVLTAMDGYALHKQGKSGLALGVQYYAAVFGAFISFFFFLAMVVPLSQLVYIFLAPEMMALYFLGCTAVMSITSDNILKGMASVILGLAVSMVGRDPVSAVTRFAYHPEMRAGIERLAVVMGCLAVGELFRQMRQTFSWAELTEKFSAKFPSVKELWRATPRVFAGTAIGTFIGAIPGIGGSTSAFIAYQQSKMWSRKPEEYGHGSIEGIAANEAAQNASQAGEMVPTFGLGIPGSGTMVILMAALLMHGFFPGPRLIIQAPQLLYASGVGLLAPTLFLALIGWPIAKTLLKVATFDRTIVLGSALALCMLGIYTLGRSVFDVSLMVFFGIVGYVMLRYGFNPAGFSIASILGKGLESELRRGLLLCDDSWWALLTRPWVALILGISFGLLIYGSIGTIRLARRNAAYRRQLLAAHLASESASADQHAD
jgi:putative tricarboxylic transport membrane protein